MLSGGTVPKMATSESWGTPLIQVLGTPPDNYVKEIDMSAKRGSKHFGLSPTKIRSMTYKSFLDHILKDTDMWGQARFKFADVRNYAYQTCTTTILVPVYVLYDLLDGNLLTASKFDMDTLLKFGAKGSYEIGTATGRFHHLVGAEDYICDLRIYGAPVGFCYAKAVHHTKLPTVGQLLNGGDIFW